MDRFIYPVNLTRDTHLVYEDGLTTVNFYIPAGVYYNCTGGISSFPTMVRNKLESALDAASIPHSIQYRLAPPIYTTQYQTGVRLRNSQAPSSVIKPGPGAYEKGLRMLGLRPGEQFSGLANSPYTALGIWQPFVDASDKRVEVERESFSAPSYQNAWVHDEYRRFIYKALHPTSVLSSPYRQPEGTPNTWGGLPTGDVNNTFESLFKSIEDGDLIYLLHNVDLEGSFNVYDYTFDTGYFSPRDNLRAHLTPFGVPERYSIDFKILLEENNYGDG